MNWKAFGAIGEVVGAIGVILMSDQYLTETPSKTVKVSLDGNQIHSIS